jgi:hypothetical protein
MIPLPSTVLCDVRSGSCSRAVRGVRRPYLWDLDVVSGLWDVHPVHPLFLLDVAASLGCGLSLASSTLCLWDVSNVAIACDVTRVQGKAVWDVEIVSVLWDVRSTGLLADDRGRQTLGDHDRFS